MSVIKKVAFYTLGCKLNFSETSTISRDFQRNNKKIVNASKKADIYVINKYDRKDSDKMYLFLKKEIL